MFGGLVIECGDDVGRGQGVFAAGREGATGGPLMKRGWSAAGTNLGGLC
jgi:hypothetical protein